MPTADRTTIKAAMTELVDRLRDNLVADPPTATKPFRVVAVGAAGVTEYARPFLSLHLSQAKTIGVVDDDKVLEVSMTLRIVRDVTAADPHAAALDAIGAVEDYFDSLIDTGILDGADGLDDRTWTFEYPKSTSGARVITATATQSLVVKVERGQHREPAP